MAIGGLGKWMHSTKRRELTGRGSVDKTIVVGAKDRDTNQIRPQVVEATNATTLQGFVREQASTNALQSFWSMLRRSYRGTFHYISPKHLQRYIDEFSARLNQRDFDTIDMMGMLAAGIAGKRLRWNDLTDRITSRKDVSTSFHERHHESSPETPRIPLPIAAE